MESLFSGPIGWVLIAAAIVFVIVRRFMGEAAQAKRLLILPVVLIAIGVFQLNKQPLTAEAVGYLALSIGVGVFFGVVRGLTIRIADRNGVAFLHYTWLTLLVWVLSLAAKFGLAMALHSIDPALGQSSANSTMLSLGITLLAEGAIVMYRAMRGQSRIMWTKGNDGGPRQMSPFVNQLQDRLRQDQADKRR